MRDSAPPATVWAAVGPLLQLPGHGPSSLEDVGMDGVRLTAGQLVVGLFMARVLKTSLGRKDIEVGPEQDIE